MKTSVLSLCFVTLLFSLVARAAEDVYRAEIDSDGVQRVEITGGSYYYEPETIIVKVGVTVELTYRKPPGIKPHNLVIKAPEAGIVINEDMSVSPKTVTFTPSGAGKFAIYCNKRFLFFKNHREKGMEAVLVVEE